MKMSERDIATYKIAQALKTMQTFRRSEEFYTKIIANISDISDEHLPLESKWEVINPLLRSLHISIRKPTERTEEFDDLDGMEILKRSEFRSCFDALCPKPHCTTCGLCGRRGNDMHLCKCPVCGKEFISDPEGDVHNSDTDCEGS